MIETHISWPEAAVIITIVLCTTAWVWGPFIVWIIEAIKEK